MKSHCNRKRIMIFDYLFFFLRCVGLHFSLNNYLFTIYTFFIRLISYTFTYTQGHDCTFLCTLLKFVEVHILQGRKVLALFAPRAIFLVWRLPIIDLPERQTNPTFDMLRERSSPIAQSGTDWDRVSAHRHVGRVRNRCWRALTSVSSWFGKGKRIAARELALAECFRSLCALLRRLM